MTAIPGARTSERPPAGERSVLTLVCDGCGHATTSPVAERNAWPQVWREVYRTGWRGWAWSFGPHYCPTCAGPTDDV